MGQVASNQISPEQQVTPDTIRFVEQVTAVLHRHGLRLPALIALQAGQPLAFLGGQLLWIAQPTLSLLFPRPLIAQTAQLLEDPAAVAILLNRLERISGEELM
jgi:hypothetical protein